jgi:signal transduction histidine kinase
LIASHLAVVGFVLIVTVLVAFVPVRRAQLRAEEERLRGVADTVALQADFVTRPGATGVGTQALRALATRQARISGTRVLLAQADGTIVFDTRRDSRLVNQRIPSLKTEIDRIRALAQDQADSEPDSLEAVTLPTDALDGYQAVIATTTASNERGQGAFYPIVISARNRAPALDRVVRATLLAAAVALVGAVGTSLWLARSIARPIGNLTAVASDISAGNLERRAPGEGDDEVGRLVRAFNAMIDRLAETYASQRTLLANIAHELRTPLTSIQGYARALHDDVIDTESERDEALAVIGEESERIGELVNQILQLSRLETGQQAIAQDDVDLAELFERQRRALAQQARAAGVTLTAESTPALRVTGDPELLTQALGNLITNGLRHTPPGGSVTVRAARLGRPGASPQVRITVADSGQGIAEEDLPHVFERFYRGAADGAQPQRRFGLGLAIAREIVTRHGGTISVESGLGRGTTFCMDLPVAPGGTAGIIEE